MSVKILCGGKPLDLVSPSPGLVRIVAYLDKLPFGTLVESHDLCTNSGVGQTTIGRYVALNKLNDYRFRIKNQLFYGSKATVREAYKQYGRQK